MSVENMQEEIRRFCSEYIAEGIDRAADNGEDLRVAVLACVEMITQLHKMNYGECWKDRVKELLESYLADLDGL